MKNDLTQVVAPDFFHIQNARKFIRRDPIDLLTYGVAGQIPLYALAGEEVILLSVRVLSYIITNFFNENIQCVLVSIREPRKLAAVANEPSKCEADISARSPEELITDAWQQEFTQYLSDNQRIAFLAGPGTNYPAYGALNASGSYLLFSQLIAYSRDWESLIVDEVGLSPTKVRHLQNKHFGAVFVVDRFLKALESLDQNSRKQLLKKMEIDDRKHMGHAGVLESMRAYPATEFIDNILKKSGFDTAGWSADQHGGVISKYKDRFITEAEAKQSPEKSRSKS